jgi:hypothetical protein
LTLLVSVLGVLAAAAVVRGARPDASWALGVATVATIVGIVAIANDGLSAARTFGKQHDAYRTLQRSQLSAAGGAAMGAREDFLGWADARMPRRARVQLVCAPTCGGMEQWVTWRLLPRAFVDRARDADWILMYNATPRDAGLRGADARRAVRFDKRMYLAPVPR